MINVIVQGPAGEGKSAVLAIIEQALTQLELNVKLDQSVTTDGDHYIHQAKRANSLRLKNTEIFLHQKYQRR